MMVAHGEIMRRRLAILLRSLWQVVDEAKDIPAGQPVHHYCRGRAMRAYLTVRHPTPDDDSNTSPASDERASTILCSAAL